MCGILHISKEMLIEKLYLIVYVHKSRKRTIQSWISIPQKWVMIFIHNAVKKMDKCNWGHSLRWRHNESDGFSNHQPYACLRIRLFRRRSKKTSKLRVTSICEGNSAVTGEFLTQRASNGENVSITSTTTRTLNCIKVVRNRMTLKIVSNRKSR